MACSVSENSGGSSFSEALSYALRRLKMTRITVKEEQRSSMRAVYKGSDVFVWLPTGYGKSLCYQAPPFLMDYKKGLLDSGKNCGVLVVSPLLPCDCSHARVRGCVYAKRHRLSPTHSQTSQLKLT